MKTKILSISLATLLLIGCKKGEYTNADYENSASADSVSVAATQQIEGKQFVKTAEERQNLIRGLSFIFYPNNILLTANC